MGEYRNSLKCQYECLNIRRRIFNNNTRSKQIAQVLNDLGVAYVKNCDYDKAIGHLKEASEIREAIYEKPNELTIETLNNLANAYYKKGDSSYQEHYSMRALEQCESYLKSDHPELARSINNFGNLYFSKV